MEAGVVVSGCTVCYHVVAR